MPSPCTIWYMTHVRNDTQTIARIRQIQFYDVLAAYYAHNHIAPEQFLAATNQLPVYLSVCTLHLFHKVTCKLQGYTGRQSLLWTWTERFRSVILVC